MALTGKRLKVMEELINRGSYIDVYKTSQGEMDITLILKSGGYSTVCDEKTFKELVRLGMLNKAKNRKGGIVYVAKEGIDFREVDESSINKKSLVKSDFTPNQLKVLNYLYLRKTEHLQIDKVLLEKGKVSYTITDMHGRYRTGINRKTFESILKKGGFKEKKYTETNNTSYYVLSTRAEELMEKITSKK